MIAIDIEGDVIDDYPLHLDIVLVDTGIAGPDAEKNAFPFVIMPMANRHPSAGGLVAGQGDMGQSDEIDELLDGFLFEDADDRPFFTDDGIGIDTSAFPLPEFYHGLIPHVDGGLQHRVDLDIAVGDAHVLVDFADIVAVPGLDAARPVAADMTTALPALLVIAFGVDVIREIKE